MPLITKRSDIDDLPGGPTPAEEQLLAACMAGEVCVLGDGKLPPENAGRDRQVRAEVLRYLILGGCEDNPVRGWGVRLSGALVPNGLDLSYQTSCGATGLFDSRFLQPITAMQSHFNALNLNGSILPGLNAQGAQVMGGVFLRHAKTDGVVRLSGATIGGQLTCEAAEMSNSAGHALNAQAARVTGGVFLGQAKTMGEVRLSSAIIGGQLDCDAAEMSNPGGDALNAESVQVTGDVFLSQAKTVGAVSLSGATIGGQLVFDAAEMFNPDSHVLNAQGAQVTGGIFLSQAKTTGAVSLPGATIGVQLNCDAAEMSNPDGLALNAQGAQVTGGLIWRDGVSCVEGLVNFTAAHLSDLDDNLACWPDGGRLVLSGLTYDRIHGDLDVGARLCWLASGSYWNGGFRPQPYTQLAKVYRTMGRDGDARRVLAERERREHLDLRRRRKEQVNLLASEGRSPALEQLKGLWVESWLHVLRGVVNYGYGPFRPFVWLMGLWLFATVLSYQAWHAGDFAPNSGVIQISESWQELIDDEQNPAKVWTAKDAVGRDWETFHPAAFGADLVVPIIDFGQTDAWTPSTARGRWGTVLWGAGFLLNLAGWIITALGAAALTGIIQKERE